MKIEKVDMIVPSFYVDWNYFSCNVDSWLKEIPLGTLYFGCNNPDEKYRMKLKNYLEKRNEKIKFIDQFGIKTLGMQITDLMKRVQTDFFVYCHTDAQPTPNSFLVLEKEMEEDVGIIESERVQYDYENPKGHPTVYPYYYYRPRSFSGYQLFRMKAIENILDKIEDDYIYRNEDIIFQNVCTQNGYKYLKSWAMHIHTCSQVNHKWTPFGEELSDKEARIKTFDMQVKGIVKYCTPDDITKVAWRDAFGVCYRENNLDLFAFDRDFVQKTNPQWSRAIQDSINEMLDGIYKR